MMKTFISPSIPTDTEVPYVNTAFVASDRLGAV
jgi:hypothetical protein